MPRSQRTTYWRWSTIVLGLSLLVGAAAAWVTFPVHYQAVALLRVASRQPVVLASGRADGQPEYEIFKTTQAQLIASNVVLNGVLRDPAINGLSSVVDHAADPVAWLKGQLTVEFSGDTEVLRIAVRTKSKEDSIRLANKVVEVYLREIVDREKSIRMVDENKLQRAYEQKVADYAREYNALLALEKTYGTSGSEAAQLKRQLAMEELHLLIADRTRISQAIRDNDLDIVLSQARAELDAEKRTADMISRRNSGEADPLSLPLLERKRDFLQKHLAEVGQKIERQTEDIASLQSVSAQVAAKQEELDAARILKNQLGAEVERVRIERLAPDRIVKVEDAMLEGESGDAVWRYSLCGSLAGLGLVLLALGLVIGRSRRLESGQSTA